WRAAARGEAVDWDALLAGYRSAVDWPARHFWRELAQHYPAAKGGLTARDAGAWYESLSATIGKVAGGGPRPPPHALGPLLLMERTFGGRIGAPAHAKAVYRRHVEAVAAGLPADRLLVFDVAEGWAPLCRFLDRPVPEEPFPRSNSREEFWQHFAGASSARPRS